MDVPTQGDFPETQAGARAGTDAVQEPGLRIGLLLVVSGPSTVGKSSFIRQFLNGTLAADIRQALPDASGWVRFEAKQFNSLGKVLGGGRDSGVVPRVIFHYDINRIHNLGFGAYEADHSLKLLQSAESILIVDIRASREVLEEHCLHRLERQRRYRGARRVVKRLKRRLFPARYARDDVSKVEDFSLLDAYRTPGWVEQSYAEWDRFLQRLTGGPQGVSMIRVEAKARPNAEPCFHMRAAGGSFWPVDERVS